MTVPPHWRVRCVLDKSTFQAGKRFVGAKRGFLDAGGLMESERQLRRWLELRLSNSTSGTADGSRVASDMQCVQHWRSDCDPFAITITQGMSCV